MAIQQPANAVVGIFQLALNGRAVDHLERLRKGRRLGSLTLAGEQPLGFAEDLEKPVLRGCAGQLGGPQALGADGNRSGTPRA